jgi:hypothetical protein
MPDRPEDPSQYGWLYPERDTEDESTRVIPRDPRAHPAAPGLPPAGPRRILPEPGAAPRRRRRFPYVKVILLLLVAWIAFLVAVPTIAWRGVDKVDAFPAESTRPADQPGTTYLQVATERREGLT